MAETGKLSVQEFKGITFDEKRSAITMNNKTVRFGEIDGREVAVKIWHQNGNGGPENELKVYGRLRTTALREFTPEPVCLLKNGMGKIISLAVEARRGEPLTVYQSQEKRPLEKAMIDKLEQAVLKVYGSGRGAALDYKMLEPDNLGFDGQGLWFCSCGLGQPDKNYEKIVKQMTGYLRKNFAGNSE